MADKRLSPDQLRARLAANLASSPERGAAIDAAREIARDLSRDVVDRLPKANDPDTTPVGLTELKYASSPAAPISVPLGKLRANKTPLDPPNDPVGPVEGPEVIERGDTTLESSQATPEANDHATDTAVSPLRVAEVTPKAVVPGRPSAPKSATERAASSVETRVRSGHPTVVHRHHEGAVLRGYRIAASLHRRAERAKLEVSAKRGAVLFWDEMMQLAIDDIPSDLAAIANALPNRSGGAMPSGGTRVLQAAIRADQEVKLRMLRLDLEEISGTVVRLEDVWTWLVERVIATASQW